MNISANMAQVQLLRHAKQEQAQSQVLEQRQSFEIVQTMLSVAVSCRANAFLGF